jgi:O-antigen/teichoic acid export membrane protein
VSLRWNLAAGFAHSVWTAVIGLVVVPFYLAYLGLEPYGLIGFFMALQALFALLDMGLAPTMNREVARCRAAGDLREVRNLLRTLASIYWTIAVVIVIATYLLAPLIAAHWLTNTSLSTEIVTRSVMLMGIVIAFRFPVGLYVGVIAGAERLVLASVIGIVVVTVANIGAIGILAFVSPTIEAFFIWQALSGLLYVVAVQIVAWRSLPGEERPRIDIEGLKRIWRFSAGMGATAILGTIFIQSDKIVLSKMVPLEELARYTLAGLFARCLYLFLTPTFNAIYPRLTAMYARGETREIKTFYENGTRLLMAIIFPVAAYAGIFSEELVTLWTSDPQLGRSLTWVVVFLLAGTAFNGAMHFPYALQLAAGKAHLPVAINVTLIFVFLPMLVWLVAHDGIVGAAAAWAILNTLYLFYGTWLTHRSILPGIATRWLVGDVGFPLLTSFVVVVIGGLLIRSAGLHPYLALALGSVLPLLAFGVVVTLSPRLKDVALLLLPERKSHIPTAI